jgi:TetR/AcrR family transcriptional regulator, transcriptional repressor for nem operon
MGHSRASKEQTHARLVAAAAARFKEHGVDGISLADLMKELKLTHGGFYKHFASRDELVTEALDLALSQSAQSVRERLFGGGQPDLSRFVDFYLADAHREGRAEGCAVAALAGDASRKSAAVQAQFREHIAGNVDSLVKALAPVGSAEGRRASALLILSALYGALTMARAVGDSALSREILRTVRKRIPALAGGEHKPRSRAKKKARAPP